MVKLSLLRGPVPQPDLTDGPVRPQRGPVEHGEGEGGVVKVFYLRADREGEAFVIYR